LCRVVCTNGKAERFIQTLLREWAYAYRYPSSLHRAYELQPWMHHYNFHRPHSAVSHRPPVSRLGFDGNNVLRNPCVVDLMPRPSM
jgi:transposase InsO family protein